MNNNTEKSKKEKAIDEKTIEFLANASLKNLQDIEDKQVLLTEEKVSEMQRLRREQRDRGEWAGGVLPFGYTTDKRTLRVDPIEFDSITKIIQWMKVSGKSTPKNIYKFVKKEEIINRHFKIIPRATVYRLFEPKRVEIYIGERYGLPLFSLSDLPQYLQDDFTLWKKAKRRDDK